MSEDVLVGNDGNKGWSTTAADKARVERRLMMNSFIGSESSRYCDHSNQNNNKIRQKSHGRAVTEMREDSLHKKDFILITEPEAPIDSRNFFVFEEEIGENTLTRKDSLILALMEHMDHPDEVKDQQSHGKIHRNSKGDGSRV